ncbi:extracellular solute-binding protein [Paenibacillus sp. ACRRX]|uniref:extracellular solute-binding protein n=1 Tax=Paenibacillus sp. ACRRX TaxID=2918206 RepID=UPI001EF4413F|nr:extracellular solute-binding protein [Paenibacillus sp. ACRRX]MCG7406973.1 extracellular solute-binding protein [Paenibacillus sp. ACRRX]
MKKRFLLLIVAVLLTMSALTGCSSSTKSDSSAANGTDQTGNAAEGTKSFNMVLRHIHIRDTAKKSLEILQETVKKTESEVPGLTFVLDGVEDAVNRDVKLKAEMAAGTQPPVFSLFGGADTRNYSKAGRLLPLNDILKELNIQDSFFDLREFTVDGQIYGLPESGYIEGFFYNKKLFEQAEAKVPTNWDELVTAMEQLKSKGITPIAMGAGSGDGWVINMLVNSMFVALGGPELQEGFATGATKWTDPAVVETFKRIRMMVDKQYIDPNVLGLKFPQGQANFYTGKAAMLFDGSWAVNAISGESSTVKADTGFFRFPDVGGPGDGYINGGWSNGYGFSATVKDQELTAVKAFINNFYNQENQKRTLVETSQIPAMKGISDLQGANELIKTIGEAQGSAKGAFPAFDSLVQPKIKVTLESTMQQLLGGKIEPEKAAERMQKIQDEANTENK